MVCLEWGWGGFFRVGRGWFRLSVWGNGSSVGKSGWWDVFSGGCWRSCLGGRCFRWSCETSASGMGGGKGADNGSGGCKVAKGQTLGGGGGGGGELNGIFLQFEKV